MQAQTTHTQTQQRRDQRRAARRREKISHNLLVLGGGLLLIALIVALSLPGKGTKISGPARTGQSMPNFSLTDLNGNPVHVNDFLGHPLLINAWATWCPPCRAEMPDLHAYYLQHQADGFVMLAINAGETQSPVEEFIAQMGFTFPVLLDPGKSTLNQLGINSFPTSIIVNRDGVIDQIHTGMLTAAMLDEKVTPLLAP